MAVSFNKFYLINAQDKADKTFPKKKSSDFQILYENLKLNSLIKP